MKADQLLVKANEEMRYTLGVLYSPGVEDLHKEWTTDDELHKATIAYSLQPDKRLRLQHDESKEVGTVVELVRWPYPVDATMLVDGMQKRVQLPAGTVFQGVIWDEDYWPLVKSGKVRGYSMGGRAMRVREFSQTGPVEVKKPFSKSRGSLVRLAAQHGGVRLT